MSITLVLIEEALLLLSRHFVVHMLISKFKQRPDRLKANEVQLQKTRWEDIVCGVKVYPYLTHLQEQPQEHPPEFYIHVKHLLAAYIRRIFRVNTCISSFVQT